MGILATLQIVSTLVAMATQGASLVLVPTAQVRLPVRVGVLTPTIGTSPVGRREGVVVGVAIEVREEGSQVGGEGIGEVGAMKGAGLEVEPGVGEEGGMRIIAKGEGLMEGRGIREDMVTVIEVVGVGSGEEAIEVGVALNEAGVKIKVVAGVRIGAGVGGLIEDEVGGWGEGIIQDGRRMCLRQGLVIEAGLVLGGTGEVGGLIGGGDQTGVTGAMPGWDFKARYRNLNQARGVELMCQ